MNQSIVISSSALTIIIIATSISFFVIRKKISVVRASKDFSIPDIIPAEGIDIPIFATYGGIKGLGMLNVSENSLNPRFILYNNYMEYKILASKNANYNQITFVREGSFVFYHYIQFTFSDRTITFSVHLANAEMVHKIGDFFRARGIPVKEKGN